MVGQSQHGDVGAGGRHCKSSDAEGGAPLDEDVRMRYSGNSLCHVCYACQYVVLLSQGLACVVVSIGAIVFWQLPSMLYIFWVFT